VFHENTGATKSVFQFTSVEYSSWAINYAFDVQLLTGTWSCFCHCIWRVRNKVTL